MHFARMKNQLHNLFLKRSLSMHIYLTHQRFQAPVNTQTATDSFLAPGC